MVTGSRVNDDCDGVLLLSVLVNRATGLTFVFYCLHCSTTFGVRCLSVVMVE